MDRALRQDLRPQPAAMAQSLDDLASGQALQMTARLAQANAADLHFADLEIPSHQMIQRDVRVSPGCAAPRPERVHVVVALESFDGFGFDQRQFEVGFRLEESSLAQGVAVTFQPGSRDGESLRSLKAWLR